MTTAKRETSKVGKPLEIYTPERKAEFLLSNAIDEGEYQAALTEVRQMGLNPDTQYSRNPYNHDFRKHPIQSNFYSGANFSQALDSRGLPPDE